MVVDATKLCQIEIQVTDLERSLSFYREVFGWDAVPVELQSYIVLAVPKDCSFGISLIPGGKNLNTSSNIVLYFAVTNPEELARKAEKWGGEIRFGPKALPGYGTIFQVSDPDGQRFGFFKKWETRP